MINPKESVHQLKNLFKLNLYEVKLWTALLKKGEAPAGELSRASGVPRSRSYDILESLEKKGFIIVKLGKPITYTAVHPHEIIERLKRNVEQETDMHITNIEKIKENNIFKELVDTYTLSGKGLKKVKGMNGLRGRDNIYLRIRGMVKNAEQSVSIVTTGKGFIRKTKELKEAFKQARGKGADIRILAPVSHGGFADKLSEIAKIKNTTELDMRFVLVDAEELLLITSGDEAHFDVEEHGVWIRSGYVGKAFTHIFENYWNK